MRQLVALPLLYFCLAIVSLSVIASIAPNLVFLQLCFFLIGACIFIVTSFINFSLWKRYHWFFYAGSVVALIVTLALGVVHKGAARWIPIGPVNFQPSQFAQPLLIVTLSFFLNKYSLQKFSNILRYVVIVTIPATLTMLQPNLSTTLIFFFFAGMMALHTDLPKKWIAWASVLGAVVMVVSWVFVIKPYQKQRVLTFLAPSENVESNYNAQQSMIAVGSGGLTGRGLGHGIQSQLRFLPERQTDFIFASLAEELGLFGSLFVLMLYGSLLLFLYLKLISVKTVLFQSILVGFLAFFTVQITINVGMNMGLLPITGITLPLLSYGGSSLLSFAFSFGILQRVVIESDERTTYLIR